MELGKKEVLRDRVLKRMEQLGLTQYSLMKRLGNKGNSSIWSLLSGRTKTFRNMEKLAKALETTVEWLTTGYSTALPPVSRPFRQPDQKYTRILALCLREWQKPEYRKLDEKTVIEIAYTIYEQTKNAKSKQQIASQADMLLAHSVRKIGQKV